MAGEKRQRNLEIVQLFLEGEAQTEIAKAYGISHQRVEQIVAAYLRKHPLDPTAQRAKAIHQLEDMNHQLALMDSVQAIRERRQVIHAQAKIAGFLAPVKVQVTQDDTDYTALRSKLFAHLQIDGGEARLDPRPQMEEGAAPGPGERPSRFDLPGRN